MSSSFFPPKAFTFLIGIVLVSCTQQLYTVDASRTARLGAEKSPIEIVVYSDFQCGFCRRTAKELYRIYRRHPARIKVYFKHFPLNRHPYSQRAALAAEAARLQGRFWEMHDLLFVNQSALSDELVIELAKEIGIDLEQFARDRESITVQQNIDKDKAEGEAIGVDGTPFFIVNGMPFRGSYADLEDRISGIGGFR